MKQSNMSFVVNENAVICSIIGQDIKARIYTRKNPEKREKYKAQRIINASPIINRFMKKYPYLFKNSKLVKKDGSNFCEALVPAFSFCKGDELKQRITNILKYEFDLSDDYLFIIDDFVNDFEMLSQDKRLREIIKETTEYKNSIEAIWKSNEEVVTSHIYDILGYVPEKKGKVKVFIMYPNVNTHRMYPLSKTNTALFFSKKGEKNPNKIISYLAHQLVHQPMFPYKNSMTQKQREEFHAFIKFMADKEIYSFLTEKSYLEIVTEHEIAEVMGNIYPYWLGYKYRNADKKGLNSTLLIAQDIARDEAYYNSLPSNSRKKKMASTYNFNMIAPEKVSMFFYGKRWMKPYEFAKIDFTDKRKVYKD